MKEEQKYGKKDVFEVHLKLFHNALHCYFRLSAQRAVSKYNRGITTMI